MKVIVFDKKTKKNNFTNYGYGKLHLINECKITEELNGIYDAELSVYLNDTKAKYLVKFNILWIDDQLYRIYNIVKNDKDDILKCHAKHIFYDLEYDFIEQNIFTNSTIKDCLSIIKFNDAGKYFNTETNILTKNDLILEKTNNSSCIFQILETWKEAELKRDNFNISILDSIGKDNGVTFTYKKTEGIEVTENIETVVTRLYPVGKDGLILKEKYLYIPSWESNEYPPYPITKQVNFENCESEGELRVLAKREAEKIGLSNVNIKINVSDLKNTELYKDMPALVTVNVGDIVTIKNKKIDTRVKVKCIKKEIELTTGNVILEFGQPGENFFAAIDNSNVKVDISLDHLKNGMYYYSNGLDININDTFTSAAFIAFGTAGNANLTIHFTAAVESTTQGLLEIKMLLDNKEMIFNPKQTCIVGSNLISYSYPLIAIEKDKAHSIDFQLKTAANANIKKEQLQIIIQGQNLAGGLSTERPHAEVTENINYIPVDISSISTNSITQMQVPIPSSMTQNIKYNPMNIVGVKSSVNVSFVKESNVEITDSKCYEATSVTTLTGTVNANVGDYVLATITVRSALIIPAGWLLLKTLGPVDIGDTNQNMSFVYKKIEEPGEVSVSVGQFSPGRIYLNLIAMKNVENIEYGDEYEVVKQNQVKNVTVIDKKNKEKLIWGCSAVSWATGVWGTNPANLVAVSVDQNNDPRQANFIDFATLVEGRNFTPSTGSGTACMVGAVRIIEKVEKEEVL